MSSEEPSTPETASIPLSTVFCASDADVIIRAAGTKDFRAHKFLLSLVSPVFKDMFTLPQPPSDTSGTLPHVDVQESPETWENVLRSIYPMPHPIIDDLDDLESLFSAAKLYDMQAIFDIHKKSFENRTFVKEDPLRLFTIACECGFRDQATHVARNAELLKVIRSSDADDMKGLTFRSYHRLVSFLVERDNEWPQKLRDVESLFRPWICDCDKALVVSLEKDIMEDLQLPCFQVEEVYSKALKHRSRHLLKKCMGTHCSVKDSPIREFIQRASIEREKLWNRLQPAEWFP